MKIVSKEEKRKREEALVKKTPNTFRLTGVTLERINELSDEYRINKTAIVELAIQKLYDDEFFKSKYPEKTEQQIEYIYNIIKEEMGKD